MDEKTFIKFNSIKDKILLNDNIFSIGSCFANEVAKYLKNNGIYVLSNPFGTIYNIYSIYAELEKIFNNIIYDKKNIYKENKLYFSLEHSTKYDSYDQENVINKVNRNILKSYKFIKNARVYIITLGTSVVYEYIKNKKIAANCHKLPHDLFIKKILNVNDIINYLTKIISLIKSNINNPIIIFTISPVRHNPGDLVENSLSKAIIRVAVDSVVNNRDIYYFPSYEIAIDELRDYKYYKNDMLHLKNKSTVYIMDKFIKYFFCNEVIDFIDEFKYFKKMINHKPRNKKSIKYYEMLKKSINILNDLSLKRNSKIIYKNKFYICKKIVDNFYSQNDVNSIIESNLINDEELLKMFKLAINIKNKKKINFNYKEYLLKRDNKYIKNYKRKLILNYLEYN